MSARAATPRSELPAERHLAAVARHRMDPARGDRGVERAADLVPGETAAELVNGLRVRVHGRAELVALDRDLDLVGPFELSTRAVLSYVADLHHVSVADLDRDLQLLAGLARVQPRRRCRCDGRHRDCQGGPEDHDSAQHCPSLLLTSQDRLRGQRRAPYRSAPRGIKAFTTDGASLD